MDDLILKKTIREALKKQSGAVRADGLCGQRIRTAVSQKIEEESTMKRINWKKTALVAAAICVLGSITAVAVGRPAYTSSHSSHDEEIGDYAAAAAEEKKLDAAAKSVEKFENGYQFLYAVPQYDATHDEEHNVLETETAMSYTYAKDGFDTVSLYKHRIGIVEELSGDTALALEDGTVLYYTKTVNKFVPPDYEKTEEDERMIAEGMNLAYGSSEVEVKIGQNVTWDQDGIRYSLFTFEEDLSADDLFTMAKEIAEK